MTRSILAVGLALGLTAGVAVGARADQYTTTTIYTQSQPQQMNPNNCSPAWRDCAGGPDGSDHLASAYYSYPSYPAAPPSVTVIQQGSVPPAPGVIYRGY